jgi:hypothetical protein
MRNLIRIILREEFLLENRPALTYRNLSDDEKEQIKSAGKEIFRNFKLYNLDSINKYFEKHGLFLGAPSKEFMQKNLNDIEFTLTNLPLSDWARKKLIEDKSDLKNQYDAIERFESGKSPHRGRFYEFFHEVKMSDEKKELTWSIVNLFDNNVSVWAQLINDWVSESEEAQNIESTSKLIDTYFGLENHGKKGGKAFDDLGKAMIERGIHQDKIINRTWGGGQENEKEFARALITLGFNENTIYNFSGEKNIVDGVGIDLAVKCDGRWIPIQVKSNENDASNFIPYQGFGAFPYGGSFKLVSKLKKDKDQRDLEDICEPLNKPVEKKPEPKIPSSVDYVGHMGWDKDLDN